MVVWNILDSSRIRCCVSWCLTKPIVDITAWSASCSKQRREAAGLLAGLFNLFHAQLPSDNARRITCCMESWRPTVIMSTTQTIDLYTLLWTNRAEISSTTEWALFELSKLLFFADIYLSAGVDCYVLVHTLKFLVLYFFSISVPFWYFRFSCWRWLWRLLFKKYFIFFSHKT